MMKKIVKITILTLCYVWSGVTFGQEIITIPIVSSHDDAEELGVDEKNSSLNPGDLDLESSDLELVDDNSWNGPKQAVGLHFRNVQLPKGTTINSVHIEFVAKSNGSDEANLSIGIDDEVKSSSFTADKFNISSRKIGASVDWKAIPTWAKGSVYQTPNLVSIVNYLINKPTWEVGNGLTFIISGSGVRNAHSFDNGDANIVPKLVIDYDKSTAVFLPKVVESLPDADLVTGWDYQLDVKPYFSDQDDALTFEAFEVGETTLPAWLSLTNGVLSGTNTVASTVDVIVKANGGVNSVTDTLTITTANNTADFTLAIFHNNDGESHLLGEEIVINGETVEGGSIGQFKSTLDSMRVQAGNRGYETVLLSSGDNFLAGLEYNASTNAGQFYDAIALDSLNYDAIDLGNHDFDFGTKVLANFISGIQVNQAPYLSSNLGFSNVPELQGLQDAGRIQPYTIVEKGGQQIGVIGLTTPLLPSISSPGNTDVSEAITDSVQKYVGILEGQGVNKIILISHLQGLDEDIEFVKGISGIDVIIAGGGDELLTNSALLGQPYNLTPFDTYPIVEKDITGKEVYIVTTPGGYRYLGNLIIDFDEAGDVTKVYDSNPILVTGAANRTLVNSIEKPIKEYIGGLATNVLAQVEDSLDFRREVIRVRESNGGNLMADALLYQAQKEHASFGVKKPEIAIQNAGGLRIAAFVKEGDFTEDLTYKIAAFSNIVSVIEDISPEKLKELMEHGLAETPKANGRFPQIAGFSVVFDPTKDAGSRVKSITLNSGRKIVENFEVIVTAEPVTLTTNDFTAKGGDNYPFAPFKHKTLGATYQQALTNYLVNTDGLGGIVSAAEYPLGVNERLIEEISEIPARSIFVLNEGFNDCEAGLPQGWQVFSVASDKNWDCTDDTRGASGEAGDRAYEINGFRGDANSDDWLISPKILFEGGKHNLSFNSMSRFPGGPTLQVVYSTDYSGAGDPSTATWTNITEAENALASGNSFDYVESGEIELDGWEGNYYVAFHYTSADDATHYRVDDVLITKQVLTAEDMNNETCALKDWQIFETETQGIISCSSEGFEDDINDYSLLFNGFANGSGEGWLISPKLAFSEGELVLEFASKKQFGGPAIEVVYSSDYKGIGNPNDATWTNIPDAEAAVNGSFAKSGQISLDLIKEDAFVAFKYTSLGSSGGQSLKFNLDEISIEIPAKIVNSGAKKIYEIQGSGEESELVNAIVEVTGIVTATFDGKNPYDGANYTSNVKGFFMQDRAGDDDETTSDAIYVFTEKAVEVGDSVEVVGLVTEFFGVTQLSQLNSLDIKSSDNTLIEPVAVTLPLASNDVFEQYEGMLVSFEQEMAVTENRNLGAFGEVRLSSDGVMYQATQVVDVNDTDVEDNTASGNSNVAAVKTYDAVNDANNFILDDVRGGSDNTPIPFIDSDNKVLVGTKVTNLEGVFTYAFSEYRLYPTIAPEFDYKEREELPVFDSSTVKVVAFNVLNYFNGDGKGGGFSTSRGAKTEADFAKQSQKIVAALKAMDADVVGLIEIENDADNGLSAIKTLVDSLNKALGEEEYDFVSTGIVKSANGDADEIKNGFIYKTSTMELVGDYQILNDSYSVDYVDSKNRPAIAQTFKEIATGEVFTTAINHLKSKGSGCDDVGDANKSDGQGNCAGTRTKAAGTLADWLTTDPTKSNDDKFIILGDLNSYAQEDAIDTLRSVGYTSLSSNEDFSYIFDGKLGTLDHALANDAALAHIEKAVIWHINSLESSMIGYDRAGDLFEPNPYRSSDHDPVLIGLNFKEVFVGTGEKQGTTQLIAYPNPTDGILYFEKAVSGIVYNTVGEVMLSFETTELIDMGALNKGLYILKTTNNQILKVIVE